VLTTPAGDRWVEVPPDQGGLERRERERCHPLVDIFGQRRIGRRRSGRRRFGASGPG
jgi:hypothetical protein